MSVDQNVFNFADDIILNWGERDAAVVRGFALKAENPQINQVYLHRVSLRSTAKVAPDFFVENQYADMQHLFARSHASDLQVSRYLNVREAAGSVSLFGYKALFDLKGIRVVKV